MIMRQAQDGWMHFFRNQEDEKPICSIKMPETYTMDDVEKVVQELLRQIKEKRYGSS